MISPAFPVSPPLSLFFWVGFSEVAFLFALVDKPHWARQELINFPTFVLRLYPGPLISFPLFPTNDSESEK